MKNFIYFLFASILVSSCSIQKKTMQPLSTDSEQFTGYLFIDAESGKTLLERHAQNYFIPASTTKIFTLYTTLQALGDSIPALRYVERGDSLIFWGTGDPSFLRSDFSSAKTLAFLQSKSNKKLYFSDANFVEKSYGQGWMWDDFNDDYQAEVSPFPVYGNLVQFDSGKIIPEMFKDSLLENNFNAKAIQRAKESNLFRVPKNWKNLKQNIPFKTDSELTIRLLDDLFKTEVNLVHIPLAEESKTIFSVSRDSVLTRMMYVSDNMLAEQLMLINSGLQTDSLDIQKGIKFSLTNYLPKLPQKPRWVDGSGLSRYNLCTPEDLVYLVNKIYREMGYEKGKNYFATNGLHGTMKSFAKSEALFLNAKSGSMSGVYNLAGFLRADSGKLIIFAVMNNNFTKPVSQVRKEVEQALIRVKKKF